MLIGRFPAKSEKLLSGFQLDLYLHEINEKKLCEEGDGVGGKRKKVCWQQHFASLSYENLIYFCVCLPPPVDQNGDFGWAQSSSLLLLKHSWKAKQKTGTQRRHCGPEQVFSLARKPIRCKLICFLYQLCGPERLSYDHNADKRSKIQCLFGTSVSGRHKASTSTNADEGDSAAKKIKSTVSTKRRINFCLCVLVRMQRNDREADGRMCRCKEKLGASETFLSSQCFQMS